MLQLDLAGLSMATQISRMRLQRRTRVSRKSGSEWTRFIWRNCGERAFSHYNTHPQSTMGEWLKTSQRKLSKPTSTCPCLNDPHIYHHTTMKFSTKSAKALSPLFHLLEAPEINGAESAGQALRSQGMWLVGPLITQET